MELLQDAAGTSASSKSSEWLCLIPGCGMSGEAIRQWEHAAVLGNGRRSRHLQLSVAYARMFGGMLERTLGGTNVSASGGWKNKSVVLRTCRW
ncbi:unnamed protein product [Urochloa humidicola]